MAEYFPRHTLSWKIEEPPALRRLTLSLLEMAILTGIVLRLYRSIILSGDATGSWLYLGGTFALGAIFLFAMLTMHLANYPIRQWLWRAPAFALVETAAEMLTSLVLIWMEREPYGSASATTADWVPMASDTLLLRMVAIAIFSLVLAGVVQSVRYALLRREHRDTTADRIHRSSVGMPLPPE